MMTLISYLFLCFIFIENHIGSENDSFLSFTNFYKRRNKYNFGVSTLHVKHKQRKLYSILDKYRLIKQ